MVDVRVRRSFRLLVCNGFQRVGPHQSPLLSGERKSCTWDKGPGQGGAGVG